MREVLFKNLTSVNSRKKDISLREVFVKDGVLAKTERRCFYFVKEVTPINDQDSAQEWIDIHSKNERMNKRHFHILKKHDDESGEDRVACKILGSFYAVVGKQAFNVAYLHSFKVRFVKE
jgi:hypothetical protein